MSRSATLGNSPTSVRFSLRSPLHSYTVSPVTCDIFIKTCSHDAEYHKYCLASIEKYCTGFRNVVESLGYRVAALYPPAAKWSNPQFDVLFTPIPVP